MIPIIAAVVQRPMLNLECSCTCMGNTKLYKCSFPNCLSYLVHTKATSPCFVLDEINESIISLSTEKMSNKKKFPLKFVLNYVLFF